jgi:hypothetical protein
MQLELDIMSSLQHSGINNLREFFIEGGHVRAEDTDCMGLLPGACILDLTARHVVLLIQPGAHWCMLVCMHTE